MKNIQIKTMLVISFIMLLVLTLSHKARSAPPVNSSYLQGKEAISMYNTSGEPIAANEPTVESTFHHGHLGFDKATGQTLSDPTIHPVLVLSPEEVEEMNRFMNQKMAEMDTALLRFRSGYTMQPQPGIDPAVLDELNTSEEGNYYLIQFSYPFPTQERVRLQGFGMRFYDYVSESGLYAFIPPDALEILQGALAAGTVRYVGSIPTAAKQQRGLADQAASNPTAEFDLTVLTFEPVTPTQLETLQELMVVERRSDGPVNILEGRAQGGNIQEISQFNFIRWVEQQSMSTSSNLEGGMGIGADVVRDTGYNGSGINVMVIDGGIAQDGTTYHPDLLSDRVLDQYDYQNDDSIAEDEGGHGTHVAGTIAGLYNNSDTNSDPAFQGVATGADLYIYKLCCDEDGYGYFSSWFQAALERATSGGRTPYVANNSWGGIEANGIYNTNSEIADRAVRGEYNQQYINMVIASGNDNGLTSPPATGKNVISVGSVKDGNYPLSLNTTDDCGYQEDDWPPGERVCYSNYGPIDTDEDGSSRVKPDLVAPGMMITSAIPWYLTGDLYYYLGMHGTSMAAPHVTGAIAQILDAYSSSIPWLDEWPEAIKAMLLATAVNVGGNTDLYGRGLVDPYHAIYSQSGINDPISIWTGNFIQGGMIDYTFTVPSDYEEVRIVLTWADPAGANEVMNNLDIFYVLDGDGVIVGNSASSDDTVEYLKVPSGYAAGTWTIRVFAISLATSQDYALAAHTILEPADLSITCTPEPYPVPGYDYYYLHQYISNSGYTAGGTFAGLSVPDGFVVRGVRIYTQEGIPQYLEAAFLYPISSGSYWVVAVGDTISGYDRHVRWFLEYDPDLPPGDYSFGNQALWRVAGSTHGTMENTCTINFPGVYLPLILQ